MDRNKASTNVQIPTDSQKYLLDAASEKELNWWSDWIVSFFEKMSKREHAKEITMFEFNKFLESMNIPSIIKNQK
jgi:hypothetical protein